MKKKTQINQQQCKTKKTTANIYKQTKDLEWINSDRSISKWFNVYIGEWMETNKNAAKASWRFYGLVGSFFMGFFREEWKNKSEYFMLTGDSIIKILQ